MSNQIINDKLVAGIGRVSLATKTTESFPLVGEKVVLTALTKWAQRVNFKKMSNPNASQTEETVENTTQSTSSELTVTAEGELRQDIRAWNYGSYADERFSDFKKRFLYAMLPQTLPYFTVKATEIARVGETGTILIVSENGYPDSRARTMQARIYRENDKANPVKTLTFNTGRPTSEGYVDTYTFSEASDRGIYDIEVDVTDTELGITLTKRINKLITITPRLAARPTAGQEPIGIITGDQNTQIKMYETGDNDLYCTFEIPNLTYYNGISIADIPAGYDAYTLVLSKPVVADDNCYSKVWLKGNGNGGVANASGTPNFSFERPLVITIDSEIPVELHGYSYNCVSYIGDVHNTVWDGRGYHNLHNGIRFTKNPVTGYKPVTNMQLLNGTSDVEVFECEFTDVSFSPIMSKTDPSSDKPQYWKGNFEEKNFWWHHNYTHDTDSEGCYLGYFDSGYQSMTYTGNDITLINLAGEEVKYYSGQSYKVTAHQLTNFRFYRNTYEHTGYDGVQISNSFGEVCYNRLYDCAWKQEASQTSGLSIQGFSGKCYNNEVIECYGPNIQMGPIGDIEFFNNIVYSSRGSGIQMLFSYNNLYQNPTDAPEGSGVVNDTIQMILHNNVIAAPGITVNGRNTVQVTELHMYDNVIANNGSLVGNMSGSTETKWKEQAVNNVVFKFTELYDKSEEYKIADYESGDFRIAYNSPLVSIGLGTSFEFDFNGYKNWLAGGISPIGPYQGKYVDSSIVHVPLTLLSVIIDGDAAELEDTELSISYSYSGNATQYRIGEQADLSDTEWVNITPSPITYQLKDTSYGTKTVYMQLRNNSETSSILSDSINYTFKSLVLDSIVIDNGAASTWKQEVSVTMDYTEGTAPAESYRVAESAEALETATWFAVINPFDFTLSTGAGIKTLYVQMKDSEGNVTDVVSSSIELVSKPQEITAVSLQWGNLDLGYKDEDGINAGVRSSLPYQNVLSNLGNVFAKAIRETLSAATFSDSYAGTVTGDDSFVYKDKYMYRNQPFTAYSGGGGSYIYSFTDIASGKYRIRIFASSVNAAVVNDSAFYKAYTSYGTDNQFEYTFEKPTSILNNVSEWMIREVDILDDGLLAIEFGMKKESSSSLRLGVMNIIDFIEVVPITSFEIGISKQTGTYIQFEGICQPADCTEDDFAWSILESTLSATINPRTGKLTISPDATTEEIITVQAVSPYNSELVRTKQVTIKYDAPLVSLAIIGNASPVGKHVQYAVVYTPDTTTQRNVTWSIVSQDGGINATIDTTGRLTFGGSGNIRIQVASTDNPSISAILDIVATYYDIDNVEYFESSVNGSLFFDTGIIPTLDTKAEITIIPDSLTSAFDLFGSRISSSDSAKMYMYSGGNFVSGGIGAINTGNISTAFDLLQKVVFTLDKDNYTVVNGDNTYTKAIGTTDAFTSVKTMYIGKINTAEANRQSMKGKLYGCKLWESGVLVADFIPCIHDGVPSIYNVVDDSYHDNLGSGTGAT